MKKTKILFAVLLLLPGGAFAQPVSERPADEVVPAVRNAFEIGVASGYTQGGGKLADEMISLGQIAGPGVTVEPSVPARPGLPVHASVQRRRVR